MAKKVAIIITTYNQEKLLEKCLISLKRKTNYLHYRVYLIDDSDKKNIGKKIKRKYPWVDLTVNKKNLGFVKSNNIGIKTALKNYDPDYVLLLNDDTEIIQRDWLSKMVEVAESDDKIGILGCRIVYPDGSLQWFAKKGKIFFFTQKGSKKEDDTILETQKINNVIGACFLIKRTVITKIGLFDEKFSPFYGEETDYCYRASKASFENVYVGNSVIVHFGAKSTSTISKDRVWFIKKKHAIRLEWLNYNLGNIIKYSLIHWASVFFKKNNISLFKKFILLVNAYLINLKNLGDILKKRYGRGHGIFK